MKKLLTFLAVGCLAASAFGQKQQEAAEQLIRQRIAEFSEHLVAADFDALVDAYTADAKIFPNGRDILRGSEAIRAYWTPPAGQTGKTVSHRVRPEELKVLGNEAYDWGYYEGTTRHADGTETNWRGKYVIVWKEVRPGDWKIYLDIWNRIPVE